MEQKTGTKDLCIKLIIFPVRLQEKSGALMWRIIELLHKETTHVLPLRRVLILALSKQLLMEEARVNAFIDDCIKKYDLFIESENGFFSERVITNCNVMAEKQQQISSIRKEVGRQGGLRSGEIRRNEN